MTIEWIHAAQQKPSHGQRVLIASLRYKDIAIAHFIRAYDNMPDHFEILENGKIIEAIEVECAYWMPLPEYPEEARRYWLDSTIEAPN